MYRLRWNVLLKDYIIVLGLVICYVVAVYLSYHIPCMKDDESKAFFFCPSFKSRSFFSFSFRQMYRIYLYIFYLWKGKLFFLSFVRNVCTYIHTYTSITLYVLSLVLFVYCVYSIYTYWKQMYEMCVCVCARQIRTQFTSYANKFKLSGIIIIIYIHIIRT